jgi:hypothetical protein
MNLNVSSLLLRASSLLFPLVVPVLNLKVYSRKCPYLPSRSNRVQDALLPIHLKRYWYRSLQIGSRYPRLQFFLLCRHITSLLRFQGLCGVWPVSVSCVPINFLALRVSLALPSRVCIILARTFFLLPRLLYLRSDVTHLKQKAAFGQYSLPFGVLSSRRITHVQRI